MNKTIPILGLAGWSGSGKTTLLEQVIRALTARGYRTAVIKHSHHGYDAAAHGKDTGRFSAAGASPVVFCSPEMTVWSTDRAETIPHAFSLAEIIGRIRGVDLILVEGFKHEPIPQIGICRADSGKGFTAPPEHFAAIVTDLDLPEDCAVPAFRPDEVTRITDFICGYMLTVES